MKLHEYKAKALKDVSFEKEYSRYDLAFEIGQMVLEARIIKGMTQVKLAEKLKTKQPSIARLENGQSLPSLTFLEKIAKALGTYLLAPKFASLQMPYTTVHNVTNVITLDINASELGLKSNVFPRKISFSSNFYPQITV